MDKGDVVGGGGEGTSSIDSASGIPKIKYCIYFVVLVPVRGVDHVI